MSGRGSERGWGSVWSSQPGLLSHLQPLSLFYTRTHTHTRSTRSLALRLSHTHTSAGWQPHDTAKTHHSVPLLYPLNHSLANYMQINIPLSSGHSRHINNKIQHIAWLPLLGVLTSPVTKSWGRGEARGLTLRKAASTAVQPSKFSLGITAHGIKVFSSGPIGAYF